MDNLGGYSIYLDDSPRPIICRLPVDLGNGAPTYDISDVITDLLQNLGHHDIDVDIQ